MLRDSRFRCIHPLSRCVHVFTLKSSSFLYVIAFYEMFSFIPDVWFIRVARKGATEIWKRIRWADFDETKSGRRWANDEVYERYGSFSWFQIQTHQDMPSTVTKDQWRRAHWARSGLGPTLNKPSRARSGQIKTGQVRPGSYFRHVLVK